MDAPYKQIFKMYVSVKWWSFLKGDVFFFWYLFLEGVSSVSILSNSEVKLDFAVSVWYSKVNFGLVISRGREKEAGEGMNCLRQL